MNTWNDMLDNKKSRAAMTISAKPGLQPLHEVRTNKARRGMNTSSLSLMGLYLGGISGGFTPSEIPEMKRDPDVSLGLEYLLTPILNAKVTIQGTGEDLRAQKIFDRFWQHDLECFKDMFCYGYCPAEVRYKEEEEKEAAPGQPPLPQKNNGKKLEYDGMILLDPTACEPWVTDGKLAYIKAFGNIKLEGASEKRPSKGFWIANDPTYSPFMGNSVLPSAWLFWRAKVGMPDSAVEVLLKANYKCAFSGLQVLYPSEDIPDDDGEIYDARAEAEWYAENIKAGTNIVLPSETDDRGERKWKVESYGGQPVDIQKMLPMMDWLTKQIHRGMGVVDDVITKEGNTGGYSRSNVSRQMFLMLALRRARRIAHTFDQMVCRPLMKRNGYPGEYELDVKIPGMEDEDPNGLGVGGMGQGAAGGQAAGQPGEEAGPLAQLFNKTMGGGKGEGEESEVSEDGPEITPGADMSLNTFLGNWRAEVMGKV